MKKLTLFIFFLLFFFNSCAQSWFEYSPEWYWGTTSGFIAPFEVTIKTFVDGDTIIDNRNYKVLKNIRQLIDTSIPDTTYTESLYGYFYEVDQKVYQRTTQGDDRLLFDTNLEIGDTLFYERPCGGMNLIYYGSNFEEISGEEIAVQYFDVETTLSGVSYDPVWVYEGIGITYLTGMFGTYDGLNPEALLECAYFDPPYNFYCYKNNFIEYSQSGPCEFPGEITTSLALEESDPAIDIYPNPFTNEIRLKGVAVDGELSVRITKIDGTLIKEFQNMNSNMLDVSALKQGMYFLSLYSKGKFIGVEKIIKSVY